MNLKRYLSIAPEVESALRNGKPVVALESAILAHGMKYPENLAFARRIEQNVRAEGAVPATIAVINGILKIGLNQSELEYLCKAKDIARVSRRDLPIMVAQKCTGAATAASAMILARLVGIPVFATAGIGGVHRGAQVTMDISADLQELRQTSVIVVCSGGKMSLDIRLTLEYLETMGVPVLGLRTEDFPAFLCAKSGFKVDYCVKDEAQAAWIAQTKWDLGLAGGVLVCNPVPQNDSMDYDEITAIVKQAVSQADADGIRGKELTPYLTDRIFSLTDGRALEISMQLACSNARAAAKIAAAYARL